MIKLGLLTSTLILLVLLLAAVGVYLGFGGEGGGPASARVDTFVTDCTVTGVGGFEFMVVSSATGEPVTAVNITAVDTLGCGARTQRVFLDSFSPSPGGGGWLVPDFPTQATPGGMLTFTIAYQGGSYRFTAYVPSTGTNCVTFQVPTEGSVSTTATNGNGSYCP